MEPEVRLLARTAAAVLASAAGEADWSAVRDAFVGCLDGNREDSAELARWLETLADTVEHVPAESREEMRGELLTKWGARLRLLLEDDPEAVARVRQFVDLISHRTHVNSVAAGQVVVQQSASVYNVLGRDLHVYGAERDVHRNG